MKETKLIHRIRNKLSEMIYEAYRIVFCFVVYSVLRRPRNVVRINPKMTKLRKRIFIAAMLSIAMINFAVFWLYVNINSLLLAFQQQGSDATYTYSFANFVQVFKDFGSGAEKLSEAFTNTMIFFGVNLLIVLPLSLMISFVIYKKIYLYKFYRVVYFLPSIISAVVLTTVFKSFIHTSTGPFLTILTKLGVPGVSELNLLGDSRYAMGTIVLYTIWTGFAINMVLFNGAMTRIPTEIVESSKIDGLGVGGELIYITIPMIWPTISTLLVFATVGIFGASGPIMLFTNGDYGTYTLSFFIFAKVFYSGQAWFNYASALGIIFTIIGIPLVLIVKWLLSKVAQDVDY